MQVFFIQSLGSVATGSDTDPDLLNWGDITVTGTTGVENNSASEQTLAGIDTPIILKAAWTSTSSYPAWGYWVRNGLVATPAQATPVSVTVNLGDDLYFAVFGATNGNNGNYDTGTVTVTNTTRGGETEDTFTFAVQYVYTAGGGGGDPTLNLTYPDLPIPGEPNEN